MYLVGRARNLASLQQRKLLAFGIFTKYWTAQMLAAPLRCTAERVS